MLTSQHNTVLDMTCHKGAFCSSIKGPAGPQGPIGYPGPRGVKVRVISHHVELRCPHSVFQVLLFLSHRAPTVFAVSRAQRERR